MARLLAYVDQGISAGDDTAMTWKQHKYRLLIALDRSDELIAVLREWIGADDAMSGVWQQSLGYLLAEQGKVQEAIECFEKLRAGGLLAASELKALSDWYMVLNEREKYKQARTASLEQTDEWQLRNRLSGQLEQWERSASGPGIRQVFPGSMPGGPISGELEDEVLDIFAVLLTKSSEPGDYLDLLRRYYRATHDFRLLTGMADAVVGQTAGKVYLWLQQAQRVGGSARRSDRRFAGGAPAAGSGASQVRRGPASARLARTDARTTRRGIAQPARPACRSVRWPPCSAFKREWSAGEPRLMADFLANLARIPDAALAQEQVRQTETLHQQAEPGSLDRLTIGLNLAGLYWGYDRKSDATDLLQAALREHEMAQWHSAGARQRCAPYVCCVSRRARTAHSSGTDAAGATHTPGQHRAGDLAQTEARRSV